MAQNLDLSYRVKTLRTCLEGLWTFIDHTDRQTVLYVEKEEARLYAEIEKARLYDEKEERKKQFKIKFWELVQNVSFDYNEMSGLVEEPEALSQKSRRGSRFYKTKQELVGSADGSKWPAMAKVTATADIEPTLNVMSESDAKALSLTIERLSSTFEIGNSRKIRSKQGLVGFANGSKIAAMADTGSRKNVMSESYAKNRGLNIERSPSTFEIGNSRKIRSTGTVSVLWAFADDPKETFSILCHVIPFCTYDLILGTGFLTATKTLTKFCHRLTRCLFSVVNSVPHFGFLGETYQRLQGTLADEYSILAIPDTGADRNIMSLQYAVSHGFELMKGRKHCGYIQFADGSYDKTVGQVKTYWTFASGERIPVTFEVLEYCCSEVIIGEEILTEQNVFVEHSASIVWTATLNDDSYVLAPFDFINSWQRSWRIAMDYAPHMRVKGDTPAGNAPRTDKNHAKEQDRRSIWNYKYDFGNKATEVEQQLELARRERYAGLHGSLPTRPEANPAASNAERPPPQHSMPVVPSIPTSQSPR